LRLYGFLVIHQLLLAAIKLLKLSRVYSLLLGDCVEMGRKGRRQARGRPEAGQRQAFIQNHEAVDLP